MNELSVVLPKGLPALGKPESGAIIDARNDVDAANTWITARASRSASTREAYCREAKRLLVWLGTQQLAFCDLKVEDVHQYFLHLANPPQSWIRPRSVTKNQKLLPTQLLAGKLSPQSISYARTVLGQLFSYLQAAGYIKHNAFILSVKPSIETEDKPSRLLDVDAWQWLWQWLCKLPCGSILERAHAARCRWLFILLYSTGMRRSEVANGLMGDFARKDGNWSLRVVGKGNKVRFVTVSELLVQELRHYRISLGLSPEPSPSEDYPLVGSVNKNKGIRKRSIIFKTRRNSQCLTPRAIGLIIETVGTRAALECDNEFIKVQIEKMTTHWMRHTNGSHRLMSGALSETTQDELGHADLRTTRLYTHTANSQRRDDAEKLSQFHIENSEVK